MLDENSPGGINRLDRQHESLLVAAVCLGSKLDDRVSIEGGEGQLGDDSRRRCAEAVDSQRDLEVGKLVLCEVVANGAKQNEPFGSPLAIEKIVLAKMNTQVGVETAQDGLMTDDKNILLSLELEDDGLQPAYSESKSERGGRRERDDGTAYRMTTSR